MKKTIFTLLCFGLTGCTLELPLERQDPDSARTAGDTVRVDTTTYPELTPPGVPRLKD